MKVDYVEDFDELVRKIMNNESLAPSTRIRAAYYLASDTDYDPSSIMRGIVTNLPADKPSAELVRSLQSIADFVPEAAKKLCDFEKVQLIENSDVD